jgi:hypothetical protein
MSDNMAIMSDMESITIRQLLRDYKRFLPIPKEGLEITRRNQQSLYIYPEKQDVRQKTGNVRQLSDNLSVTDEVSVTGTMPEKNPEQKMGWCELHFEKGVEYPLTLISYEDGNGEPVFMDKLACPKCVEKYEKLKEGKVYYG